MSYKGEVIADSSGAWVGNALRFRTSGEALQYIQDLRARWTLVREIRVVESDEPANYAIVDGMLRVLTGGENA